MRGPEWTWTPDSLTDRLGGDAPLVRELLDIFFTEYPVLLREVRTSAARGDGAALRRSAHALRGSLTNFIDDGPTTTALALERAGEDSRLGDVPQLLARLEQEVEVLVKAMRTFAGADRCGS
jgi:HPt (histidine-containing phosphotransfer) domain-containing protein